jgi:hypothetical protein
LSISPGITPSAFFDFKAVLRVAHMAVGNHDIELGHDLQHAQLGCQRTCQCERPLVEMHSVRLRAVVRMLRGGIHD